MKKILLIILFSSTFLYSQNIENSITEKLKNEKIFQKWKSTFSNLEISNFEEAEVVKITNQEIIENQKDYPEYMKNIFTYSPNKKMFVNIYDDLGIIKINGEFFSDPDSGFQAYLHLTPMNKDIIIYKGGLISGISEVLWLGNNRLILMGTEADLQSENLNPIIVVVYLDKLSTTKYVNKKSNMTQSYTSEKIKKLNLKLLNDEN